MIKPIVKRKKEKEAYIKFRAGSLNQGAATDNASNEPILKAAQLIIKCLNAAMFKRIMAVQVVSR